MLTGRHALDQQAQHHPWRAFRELVAWRLRWARLPNDEWGDTDWAPAR